MTASTDPIVDEVAWAQVENERTITIEVVLTPDQLGALCRFVDRTIKESLSRTDMDQDELDAIQAIREAWPYRWREPGQVP
jgi:hypothetical protein